MKRLLALAVATLAFAAAAENYLGTLKPPQSSLTPGLYSFATGPASGPATSLYADNSVRLKLGYKYSRYLSVEGEFVDFGRSGADIFASPGNLASAFRSTGFGVDTIATLPLWRFSFYGRMGAYRGDRNGFGTYSTALLADSTSRGTRLRYGLGMRYDFTKAFGIRAEMERYSALGSQVAGDIDADQFSVGVSWRF
jgi:OmpA-OmpF porin, OOP family